METNKNWWLWMLLGVLSLIAGLMALANPFGATLTAELIAGWSFTLIGVLSIIGAFTGAERGRLKMLLGLAVGAVFLFLGISLLANPLQGIISLTFLAAVLLVIAGVFRLVFAFGAPTGGARIAMILSGLISILLAVMIFTNFPASALVVLGLFLAIELISNGVSLIMLSLMMKNGTLQPA